MMGPLQFSMGNAHIPVESSIWVRKAHLKELSLGPGSLATLNLDCPHLYEIFWYEVRAMFPGTLRTMSIWYVMHIKNPKVIKLKSN